MQKAKKSIFISLVVATVGRLEELKKLLESFRAIEEKDFEVIVADQNDHDEVKKLCDQYSTDLALKYVHVPEKNASKARNFGARHASGRWVGFPDDDCIFLPQTLQELKNTIRKHRVQMVTGAILDFDYQPLSRTYRKSCRLSLFNVIGRIPEPALFMEKKIFDELNGFDESFGPGSINFAGEGMELGLKAAKQKIKMYFNAEIIVLHANKFKNLKCADFSAVYKYAYANALAVVKHFKHGAYIYLLLAVVFFFPKLLYKYQPGKFQFLLTNLIGSYDGIILKKHRRE